MVGKSEYLPRLEKELGQIGFELRGGPYKNFLEAAEKYDLRNHGISEEMTGFIDDLLKTVGIRELPLYDFSNKKTGQSVTIGIYPTGPKTLKAEYVIAREDKEEYKEAEGTENDVFKKIRSDLI